jgi:hypothetical protein
MHALRPELIGRSSGDHESQHRSGNVHPPRLQVRARRCASAYFCAKCSATRARRHTIEMMSFGLSWECNPRQSRLA